MSAPTCGRNCEPSFRRCFRGIDAGIKQGGLSEAKPTSIAPQGEADDGFRKSSTHPTLDALDSANAARRKAQRRNTMRRGWIAHLGFASCAMAVVAFVR